MKVALIEIGGSHDECLYSQLLYLKANSHSVTLICSSDLKGQVKSFTEADEQLFFEFKGKGLLSRMLNVLHIRKALLKGGFEKVIFNTAQGNLVRSLLKLPFPKSMEFIGTIHDLKKLPKSFTQRQITKKIKKYFVLNDYLLADIPENYSANFSVYYPIFFPKFNLLELQKPADEIWIGIPGRVEFGRRDYETLLEALTSLSDIRVKFILLGKSEATEEDSVEKELVSRGLNSYFKIWNSFINNDEFHSYLQQCDFIMPLIHPEKKAYYTYFKHQVSGSYNLAFAYKTPLLCDEKFSVYTDFSENAVFYSESNLADVIKNLSTLKIEIESTSYREEKWLLETQQRNYNNFIESE